MRPGEVEQWAVRVLSRLEERLPLEDDRVELKRELPADHYKAARRIAGHANQVRRDRILWIAGVDEQLGEVVGVSELEDFAAWWTRVESHFDDIAPSPSMINVTASNGLTVIALGFDTSRPPYTLRTGQEEVSREVPWREGTRVRSAKRHDLLRLLVPLAHYPEVDLLGGYVEARTSETEERAAQRRRTQGGSSTSKVPPDFAPDHLTWSMTARFYMDTPIDQTLVFPDHRCHASIAIGSGDPIRFRAYLTVDSGPPGGKRAEVRTSDRGDRQLVVSGSGPLMALLKNASTALDAIEEADQEGNLELRFASAGAERLELVMSAKLRPYESKEPATARWAVEPA